MSLNSLIVLIPFNSPQAIRKPTGLFVNKNMTGFVSLPLSAIPSTLPYKEKYIKGKLFTFKDHLIITSSLKLLPKFS